MKAIVYTSNTGSAAAYAQLLSEQTGLPYYSLEDAAKQLSRKIPIIYIGWIMASKLKGYKHARKRYDIKAVCGVGMGATGTQIPELRKRNHINEFTPVFSMQGGFHLEQLTGIYKLMMTIMVKTAGKALSEKPDRSQEEEDMLDMMMNGTSHVNAGNLAAVVEWYQHETMA